MLCAHPVRVRRGHNNAALKGRLAIRKSNVKQHAGCDAYPQDPYGRQSARRRRKQKKRKR